MATTSARALRLLSLLTTGTTLPASALAERLEASPRTVRRDVETLRELGYDVETVHGAGGGYRMRASGPVPPLVLAEDEVVAVVVALQTASAVLVGLEESGRRALRAVQQVVPRRLRASSQAFPLTVLPNQWEFPAAPLPVGIVREVGSAVRLRQLLRLSLEAGPAVLAEPHHLVVWAARWYLVCREPGPGPGTEVGPDVGAEVGPDVGADARRWRVLRLDRLRGATPTGRTFGDRAVPGGSAADLVRRTAERGDVPAPWPCQGSAVVAVPAALAAQFAPGGAVVEVVAGGRSRLRMGAWSWVGLAGLFLTFGADLDEVEPPPLREALRAVRDRIGRIEGIGG